jgi:hypothetical protein
VLDHGACAKVRMSSGESAVLVRRGHSRSPCPGNIDRL